MNTLLSQRPSRCFTFGVLFNLCSSVLSSVRWREHWGWAHDVTVKLQDTRRARSFTHCGVHWVPSDTDSASVRPWSRESWGFAPSQAPQPSSLPIYFLSTLCWLHFWNIASFHFFIFCNFSFLKIFTKMGLLSVSKILAGDINYNFNP